MSTSYDGAGNRLTRTDEASRVTTWTYDKENRERSVSPAGETTLYTYDEAGHPTSVVRPEGNGQTMAYDTPGRLASVTDAAGETRYEYDANDNLRHPYGPSGSHAEYEYDAVETGAAFSTSGMNLYGYNDRGEVVSSERYAGEDPDAPGAPSTEEKRSYEYDPIGNRKESVAGAQQAAIYETNVVNQYTNIAGGKTASPEYDHDGNMTAYEDTVYSWNAENRLVSVETGDKKVAFLYDYMGRRVRKQVYAGSPGSWSLETEKRFVYDGWNLVREIAVSGGSDKYFVWGLDLSQSLQGAGGIGGLLCSVDGGKARYFLYDANGNVGQVVDAADGSLDASYRYDAFGNSLQAEGAYAGENAFRFSTKYFDGETGLYYFGYRFYSSNLGMWVNRDPIGESGGINLYVYTKNNPFNKNDYLGLSSYGNGDEGGLTKLDFAILSTLAVGFTVYEILDSITEVTIEITMTSAKEGLAIISLGVNSYTEHIHTYYCKGPHLGVRVQDQVQRVIDRSGLDEMNSSLSTAYATLAVAEIGIWAYAVTPELISAYLLNPEFFINYINSLSPGETPSQDWAGVMALITDTVLGKISEALEKREINDPECSLQPYQSE